MSETVTDYRKYLDPRTLARIGSLDLRARLIVEGLMTGMHRSPYQGASVELRSTGLTRLATTFAGSIGRCWAKPTAFISSNILRRRIFISSVSSMPASRWDTGRFVARATRPCLLLQKKIHGQVAHATWTKYDHATAIAASLSYMAIQQQDSVGLAVFDRELRKYLKPSNSPAQWKTITQELTLVPRTAKTGTGHVLDQLAEKLTHRSLIVVLSDFFDDLAGIQQGLRHLRYKKHELMVFQILDPMEIEFPFEDVTLFKGMEELGELLTEPRALREGYLEQLNQFTEELKRMCRSVHVDFTRMNSGEALDVSLSNFLATRSATMK